MASSATSHRAVCAGLSCGVGLAVPVAAYALSLPFGQASDYVAAAALPFAVGAVAGVGIYAASMTIADRRAAAEPKRAAVDPDVPVISRADNGLSEDDAWAMIDAMTEKSPVSCDAAASRDVYQIAIDELSQADQTGRINRDDIAAAARAAAGVSTAPAGTTAQFIAMASAASATAAMEVEHDQDTDAARAAALDSLSSTAAPVNAAATAQIPSVEEDTAATAQVESVIPAAANLVETTASLEAEDDLPDASEEEDVPMFDYSGHEDMWASALAILDEPIEDAAPVVEPEPEPVYVGRHSRAAVASTLPTAVPATPERAEAVAEGARATQMHTHVNQMLEEELDKVDSNSVRHTSREYLKVIQGGTMAMPRLRAEA